MTAVNGPQDQVQQAPSPRQVGLPLRHGRPIRTQQTVHEIRHHCDAAQIEARHERQLHEHPEPRVDGTDGKGQPLSFDEIPWFDVRGDIQRCDWSGSSFFCVCQARISRLWVSLSQSQRCISHRTSNHGISPNDSASDSGRPLPYRA